MTCPIPDRGFVDLPIRGQGTQSINNDGIPSLPAPKARSSHRELLRGLAVEVRGAHGGGVGAEPGDTTQMGTRRNEVLQRRQETKRNWGENLAIWQQASRRRGFEKSRPLNKTSEHILTRCRAAFKARKTLLGVSVGCKVKVIRSCPFGRDVMLSLGSEVRG